MKYFLLLIVIFFPLLAYPQQHADAWVHIYKARLLDREKTATSLRNELAHAGSDKDKVLLHSLLSLTYRTQRKFEAADQEVQAAEKLLKDTNTVAAAWYYFAQGRLYQHYEINDKAFSAYRQSYRLFVRLQQWEQASMTASYTGAVVPDMEQYIYADEAMHCAEMSGDTTNMIDALQVRTNFIMASIKLAPRSPYTVDSLLAVSGQAVRLIKNEARILNKGTLTQAYFNYGYYLLAIAGKEREGLFYMDKALAIARTYKLEFIMNNYYGALGEYYLNKGDASKAKMYFLKGIEELSRLPYAMTHNEYSFYEHLKQVAYLEHNLEDYRKYDLKCTSLEGKLFDEKTQKNIASAMVVHDLKKKEEMITALEAKNRVTRWLVAAFALLFLSTAVLLFYIRKSQKLKMLLADVRNKQLLAEKTQVQKELLGSVLHLERKNEVLNDLKLRLLEQNKQKAATVSNEVFRTIEEGLLVDDDFEKFKNNFNPIYPDFFNKLQEQAGNSLTQLDLKYCGFILMKLSNKEIAQQMNVEPKSIRMARYRIKQKLGLPKETELDAFIAGLV
jgi:DNA-binding CsgD family transcriptional regulator